MRPRILLCILALVLMSGSVYADTFFTGELSASQEVPPNPSTATGYGRVTLDPSETSIRVSVTWQNMTGNATAGHIHGPAAPGANGPVIFDLAPVAAPTGSVIALTFAVTPQQVADLKAGLWYFNIHTATNPGGEIRGQIRVDSPYIAYMDNNQEVPANSSTARGYGAVSVKSDGSVAFVNMIFLNLSGPATAGHVHSGRSGTNGAAIFNLNPPAVTSGGSVDWVFNMSPTQAAAMRQGQLYLNVHTAANPGGEIRGQIQRRRSTVADFDGDGLTDAAIARPNTTGNSVDFWIKNSSGGVTAFPLGNSADFNTARIQPCDFDGDGKDDVSIWRSAATPSAGFLIMDSSSFTVRFEQFGTTGDDPRVVYDYDGDGRCDPAVFRTSDDVWYYLGSANNANRNITFVRWGSSFANPGDFDGDGKGDFANQVSGQWWILRSSDLTYQIVYLGSASMFGTPGDYDGDGKTDIAGTLTETSQRAWYYASSLNPTQSAYVTRQAWGPSAGTTNRAQGDYDGDGKSDYAVWVEGATNETTGFWILPSNGNPYSFIQWGQNTAGTNDFPITGYNNR